MKKTQTPLLFAIAFIAMAATTVSLPTIPQNGKSIQSFVPKGWHVLSVTEGDIDSDQDADAVVALASDAENDPNSKGNEPRLLVFLQKEKGGYKLAASTDKALLCKTCGRSDPFQKPTIEDGDVIVRHDVTGKKHIATAHHFHYQNGNWYLIGKKTDTYNASGTVSSSVETNYVTGKKVTSSSDRKASDFINFNPKPPSNVESFNVGQEYWDVMNWGSGS